MEGSLLEEIFRDGYFHIFPVSYHFTNNGEFSTNISVSAKHDTTANCTMLLSV
jgi:hypothetical protein